MPDRLAELVRQRALVQEHLAWLEREIAAASTSSTSRPTNSSAPTPLAATAKPSVTPSSAAASASAAAAGASAISPGDAEKLLEEYRVEPTAVKSDVRKGCLLYFAAALVLLGLGVTALYFLIGTR